VVEDPPDFVDKTNLPNSLFPGGRLGELVAHVKG
jgi:hypothetical protein